MDSAKLLMTVVSSSFLCSSPNPKFTHHVSSPKPAAPPIARSLQSRNPNLNSLKPVYRTPLSCSAVTSTPHIDTSDRDNLTGSASAAAKSKLQLLIQEFQALIDPIDRVKKLLHYAELLPQFEDSLKTTGSRVPGCTAQVWIHVELDDDNRLRFWADSDSEITRGFCACLVWVLDGATPEEVLAVNTDDLGALSVAGLNGYSSSRSNTWHNVLMSMQKRTKALVAQREGLPPGELFPSLIISADGVEARGSYAEAQARFLLPDKVKIQELVNLLEEKRIGVVAHFYMDPEVQGVLTAAQKFWPHIHISDSLVMADSAVNMAKGGCKFITVLGVDFMSENVRAILDQAGFPEVGVYRMSTEQIGCSLADAAASPGYIDYLSAASSISSPSLHVVYINTSLETKAFTHEIVPTITCTSSNVVQTILQAFAEVPNLNVWYGPDTYMGANIMELFRQMSVMTDEEIASVHPKHNRNSIKSLIPRLRYFQDGTCIVHHLFGHEVVSKINEMYCDAFITAHFEVPGEMFSLAMEAKRRGMGVVGSTQGILDFIKERVREALDRNTEDHLQFVLGTESGMLTSIVSAVRGLLCSVEAHKGAKVSVEIVFPVSSESISRNPSSSSGEAGDDFSELKVIPGVASGEGCSLHGGCASCPYMKMNSLGSLLQICRSLPHDKVNLSAYEAARFSMRTPNGKLIADVGCEPILHMRHFQATKKLPEKLIQQILQSGGNGR